MDLYLAHQMVEKILKHKKDCTFILETLWKKTMKMLEKSRRVKCNQWDEKTRKLRKNEVPNYVVELT